MATDGSAVKTRKCAGQGDVPARCACAGLGAGPLGDPGAGQCRNDKVRGRLRVVRGDRGPGGDVLRHHGRRLRASAGFLPDADDADELRRQGHALLLGAGALIASGSSLILLSLAGPGHLRAAGGGSGRRAGPQYPRHGSGRQTLAAAGRNWTAPLRGRPAISPSAGFRWSAASGRCWRISVTPPARNRSTG